MKYFIKILHIFNNLILGMIAHFFGTFGALLCIFGIIGLIIEGIGGLQIFLLFLGICFFLLSDYADFGGIKNVKNDDK